MSLKNDEIIKVLRDEIEITRLKLELERLNAERVNIQTTIGGKTLYSEDVIREASNRKIASELAAPLPLHAFKASSSSPNPSVKDDEKGDKKSNVPGGPTV